jgi:hypothetical protein
LELLKKFHVELLKKRSQFQRRPLASVGHHGRGPIGLPIELPDLEGRARGTARTARTLLTPSPRRRHQLPTLTGAIARVARAGLPEVGRNPPRSAPWGGIASSGGVEIKGSVNAEDALRRAIFEPITVKDSGKTKRMTKFEVACRQLANKAAAGDTRALKLIMQLLEGFGGDADFRRPIKIEINKEDLCVL